MKILPALTLLALVVFAALKIEAAATSALENNKAEFFVKNNLLKFYGKSYRPLEVTVPQKPDFTLQQVAIIQETIASGKVNSEYVAIYKQNKTEELLLVLYNLKSQEQLIIDSLSSVEFNSSEQSSRILLKRSGSDRQAPAEALLVPGLIQVAQKG